MLLLNSKSLSKLLVASSCVSMVSSRLWSSGRETEAEREASTSVSSLEATIAAHSGNVKTVSNVQPEYQFEEYLGIAPRAYEPWPENLPLPCVPAEEDWINLDVQDSPTSEGFMYMKLYKTGSSTTSGIDLRIARNVANRMDSIDTPMCKARFDHGPWTNPAGRFKDRIKEKSFLWSVVRDPTKRMISAFFHMRVSRRKEDPTDHNFKDYIYNENPPNFYNHFLSPDNYDNERDDPVETANKILAEYDFIGVTERMDEVAVLLMMLLDIPMGDILYLSAKHHGGYDDAGFEGHCTYIWPSFVSEGMQEFFDSEEWKEMTKYDLAFYHAANRSMDLTIEKLGRYKVEANLVRFRNAQNVAHERCQAKTVYPCDEAGRVHKNTDCLWNDSGCGVDCLDEVANELDLW